MKKIFYITTILTISLCSCSNKQSIQSNNWELKYTNGINVYHEGQEIAHDVSAEYEIGNSIVTS